MSATTQRDPEKVQRQALAVGAITPDTLNGDLLNLIKSQICKPKYREATDDELAFFAGVCMRTKLDPFARQIFAIFRRDDGKERMTIQTSIDGFRLIAERTGKYEGGTPPMWCDSDGRWHEVWTGIGDNRPFAARVGVWKTGAREPTFAIGYWSMYYDPRGPIWKSAGGGAHMLAKCTEAVALRRAFPQELSGLYTDDEMAANSAAITVSVADDPPADAVVVDDATPIALERAAELAAFAFTVGVDDRLQLAASHAHGADVGGCSTVEEAAAALARLTEPQAEKLHAWIGRKADEAASPAEQEAS